MLSDATPAELFTANGSLYNAVNKEKQTEMNWNNSIRKVGGSRGGEQGNK